MFFNIYFMYPNIIIIIDEQNEINKPAEQNKDYYAGWSLLAELEYWTSPTTLK